ncbi:hypothetical protein V5799_017386 [Amblyomma americanum]|uniref:Peptidase M13 C-terminal domain-containing protein n=1 Tax=Amblyomma americanum TaxID=6943 RepID=A0AAQ4F3C5_AMBAM
MASSPPSSATSSPSHQKSRSKGGRKSRHRTAARTPESPQNARSAQSEDKQGGWRQEVAPLQPQADALDVPVTLSTVLDRGASPPELALGSSVRPSCSDPKPTGSKERPSTALQTSAPKTPAQVSLVRNGRGTVRNTPFLGAVTGLTSVAHSLQVVTFAEAGTLSLESPYRSKEHSPASTTKCTVIAGVVTAVFTAIVGSLVIRLLLPSLGENKPSPGVCTSTACETHRIIIGIDRQPQGQKPCDDFGRFVCGGWKNTQPLLADTVHAERVTAWLLQLSMPGTYSDPKYTVLRRVAQMAADCKDQARGHDATAVTALVEFMTREFFPWLGVESDTTIVTPDDYYVALRTLFQLAVKWSLPMWFDIYLSLPPSKEGNTPNRSISFRPCPMGVMWKRIHDIVLSYKGFYTTYLNMFMQNVYDRNNVKSRLYLSFLANSSTIQGHIFGNLTHAYVTGYTRPVIAEAGDLPSFGKNISADQWIEMLQSSYSFKPPITKSNVAFASNDAIITSMTQLLNTYSARHVTFHTAWWLTQILATHTSKEVSHDINRDKKGSLFYALSCGVLMSASYHVLIASINLSGLTTTEQTSVLALLNHVYSSGLHGLRSAQRIDNRTRNSLTTMLAETSTVIWPDERHQSDESLLRLYGDEYNTTLGFFGHWRTSRAQLQRSVGSTEYAMGETLFKLDSRLMATYNPHSKVITVAEAALHSPFFYPQATSAILFGGLGFVYAKQVVRSLHTMAVYASRRNPLNQTVSFWDLLLCPEAVDPRTVFPELPALQIAHAAYKKFRRDDEDLPLRGMEQYSAEQVFFLTACHGTCELGANGQLQSEPCNHMMRNFRPFSDAFSCPPGSRMNPKEKCHYL